MKKNKGAMIALGEESDGDESDDSSDDGRAFVAKCIVIDEAGVAHVDDGEDDDDEIVEVNAYTDSDETSENELVEAVLVGNKCNNNMAANDTKTGNINPKEYAKTGDINPKEYAKPLKQFLGAPSRIYLGFSSSDSSEDESVPELEETRPEEDGWGAEETTNVTDSTWYLGKTTDKAEKEQIEEDNAYAIRIEQEQQVDYWNHKNEQTMNKMKKEEVVTVVSTDDNTHMDKFETLRKVLTIIYSEEMNNIDLTAEERGRVGYASAAPTVKLIAAVRPLAAMLGVTRVEQGTVRGIRAVLAGHLFKKVYDTHEKAFKAHLVSRRSYCTWKKRVWQMEISMGRRILTADEVATQVTLHQALVGSKQVLDGVLNNDGSRKDGFLHETAAKLETAKEMVANANVLTEAETVVLYAEADAKQREDAAKRKYKRNVYREGSINETKMINTTEKNTEPDLPNTTNMMDMVKQRVRQLDAMKLEPDDGRLAVKEKYTILATVAMEEAEDEMCWSIRRG